MQIRLDLELQRAWLTFKLGETDDPVSVTGVVGGPVTLPAGQLRGQLQARPTKLPA